MDACKSSSNAAAIKGFPINLRASSRRAVEYTPSVFGSNSSCASPCFYGKLTRCIHSSFCSTGTNIAVGLCNFYGVSLQFFGGNRSTVSEIGELIWFCLFRPTKPLEWWECGEILGGRDGLAGGTWLACSRTGRVAFVTNVREGQSLPQAKSRGDLPVRFLKSKKNPLDSAKEVAEEANQYNGFNLIIADISSKTMFYITNRPTTDSDSLIAEVSPGIHVLTNARLDSPWPKAQRLGQSFRELLNKNGDGELPAEEMVEKLMTNTVKDDESLLPGIYSPRREYQCSSIFVDTQTELGRYGTGSLSALSVKNSGEASFFQRNLENDEWIDNRVTFQVEDFF